MTDPAFPHVAVLGATGRTGRPLVSELLDRGHSVSVLARDPAKLGSLADRVRVVTGSSDDPTLSPSFWTAPTPSSQLSARSPRTARCTSARPPCSSPP